MARLFVALLTTGALALTHDALAGVPIRSNAATRPPAPFVQAAESVADAAASACRTAPTRRCVADMALAAAITIEDSMWRDFFLKRIAEIYARTGDIDPVLDVVAKSGSDQYRVRLLSDLAESTAKIDAKIARKVLRSAVEVLNSSEVDTLGLDSYAYVAEKAVAVGDVDTARQVVDTAVSLAGSSPELRAGFELARAQTAIGDTEQALATADTLARNTSDTRTSMQAAEIQASAGKIELARATIAKASDLAKSITSNIYNHEALEQSCSANIGNRDWAMGNIFEAQVQIGDLEPAIATAQNIEDSYWRAAIMGRVLGAPETKIASADAVHQAFRVALAAAARIEPGGCRGNAITDIAVAEARAGDLDGALATAGASNDTVWTLDLIVDAWMGSDHALPAKRVEHAYVRAAIFAAKAIQQADAGDDQAARSAIDAALIALGELDDQQQRRSIFLRIAGAEARLGDVSAVKATLEAARKAGDHVADARWNSTVAAMLANAQANAGHSTEAFAAADDTANAWTRVDVLIGIAASLPE